MLPKTQAFAQAMLKAWQWLSVSVYKQRMALIKKRALGLLGEGGGGGGDQGIFLGDPLIKIRKKKKKKRGQPQYPLNVKKRFHWEKDCQSEKTKNGRPLNSQQSSLQHSQ